MELIIRSMILDGVVGPSSTFLSNERVGRAIFDGWLIRYEVGLARSSSSAIVDAFFEDADSDFSGVFSLFCAEERGLKIYIEKREADEDDNGREAEDLHHVREERELVKRREKVRD